jgi:hypothetical protein
VSIDLENYMPSFVSTTQNNKKNLQNDLPQWILVGVSITDFARPADQLSPMQCGALAATGLIWTRWCLIIKPKNYLYDEAMATSSPPYFLLLYKG